MHRNVQLHQEGKRLFGRSGPRCKNNIKIVLQNVRLECVDCIHGLGLLGTVRDNGCEISGP
jgi:hypothetical protein